MSRYPTEKEKELMADAAVSTLKEDDEGGVFPTPEARAAMAQAVYFYLSPKERTEVIDELLNTAQEVEVMALVKDTAALAAYMQKAVGDLFEVWIAEVTPHDYLDAAIRWKQKEIKT